MTDAVAIAMIAAIPPTMAALAALIMGIVNRGKIHEVYKATNSMKDELVEATRVEALQTGHAAGMKEAQSTNRRADDPKGTS